MKYLLAVPVVAAIVGAMWALGAWLLMLSVGIVHHDWLHTVPTIGYHAAFPLTWALGVLTGSTVLALCISVSASRKSR